MSDIEQPIVDFFLALQQRVNAADPEAIAVLEMRAAIEPDSGTGGGAQQPICEITESGRAGDGRSDRTDRLHQAGEPEQGIDRRAALVGGEPVGEQTREILGAVPIARHGELQVEEVTSRPVEDEEAAVTERQCRAVGDAREARRLRAVGGVRLPARRGCGHHQGVDPDVGLTELLAVVVDGDVVE